MTSDGSGSANAGTRSACGPAARIASTCSTAISLTRDSSRRIRRTVNWPVSARRSRVCSGGSMNTNIPSSRAAVPVPAGAGGLGEVASW